MTNYRESYACTGCGVSGVKLWRDYNTCASAVELKCATPAQIAYEKRNPGLYTGHGRGHSALDADGLFAFRQGDQLGGLVPAVPTEEGDTFWGYTSVPAEGIEWWLAMPTYRDNTIEQRCIVALASRVERQSDQAFDRIIQLRVEATELATRLGLPPDSSGPDAFCARTVTLGDTPDRNRASLVRAQANLSRLQAEQLRMYDVIADLRWKSERRIFEVVTDFDLTVWGTKTDQLDEAHVIRYGAEMPRSVKPGDRIAVRGDQEALLIDPEADDIRRAWMIMTDRNGQSLALDLWRRGMVRPVPQTSLPVHTHA